ncbi:hypothetical protein [Leptospirillum ferriphilum]|uniref:hypothetical protein n=1 Tax=Leptospirillum ferriphilum TaxID=178606 RepID=UPI0006B22CE2|nr:hypothetical protein [Leptospirillum ferriphilum]
MKRLILVSMIAHIRARIRLGLESQPVFLVMSDIDQIKSAYSDGAQDLLKNSSILIKTSGDLE